MTPKEKMAYARSFRGKNKHADKPTIQDVADRLGWDVQYVRIMAQRGKLPFVLATTVNGKRYRYDVLPAKFREYLGDVKA